MKSAIHSSYLNAILTPKRLARTVDVMCDRAYEVMMTTPFDAIAFCGMSGAGVAFPMSARLGMPTIMVRKEDQSHHVVDSWGPRQWLEGAIDVDSYLIVDDQISSGKTVVSMMAKISAYRPTTRCVGIMLYNSSYNRTFETPRWMASAGELGGLEIPPKGFPDVQVYGCHDETW